MTEFWIDSNFFIAAKETNQIPLLKRLFAQLRNTHQFFITKRIRNEVFFFNDAIRLYFKTITVDNTSEFRNFCFSVRYCLGNSKGKDEPADQSLAFAAAQSDNENYVVTNDEGFQKAKEIKKGFMSNVQVIEPMEFLELVIPELSDANLISELEKLIIDFADHFIKHRLRDQRPIERILENLLLYSTTKDPLTSIKTLPDELRILLQRFISNEILTPQEENKIKLVEKYLMPFVAVYSSDDVHEKSLLIKTLYIQIPRLLSEFKDDATTSQEEIFKYHKGIEELIERELFRLRISETVYNLEECLFDEAYIHFIPLLETNWSFTPKPRALHDLKLLYGIFQLYFDNSKLIVQLIENGFWDQQSEIKQIFELFLQIKEGNISEMINEIGEEDLTIVYNLGLFFCNTGNNFGVKIFDALFQIPYEVLEDFPWHLDYLKRYSLELKINQKKITEPMKLKFLKYLDKKDLEDNTRKKLDRNSELSEPTPLEEAPFFYKQDFFLIRSIEDDDKCEAYCWNDSIRSIIIISIPKNLCSNFKNVRIIKLISGMIKTKRISMQNKKNARIIIELEENFVISLERFKLNII